MNFVRIEHFEFQVSKRCRETLASHEKWVDKKPGRQNSVIFVFQFREISLYLACVFSYSLPGVELVHKCTCSSLETDDRGNVRGDA